MAGVLSRWWKSSIRHKLMAAFLGIFFITYGPAAVVIFSSIESAMRAEQVATLDQIALEKRQRLAGFFTQIRQNLRAWAGLEVMNDIFAADVDKRIASTLARLKEQYDLPGDLYVFDTGGRLVAATRGPLSEMMLPARWDLGEREETFIGKHPDPLAGGTPPEVDRKQGRNGKTAASPQEVVALVRQIRGRFADHPRIGVLVAVLPWSAIVERIVEKGRTPVLLLDVAERKPLLMPAALDLSAAGRVSWQPLFLAAREVRLAGRDFIAGYADGRGSVPAPWRLAVLEDAHEANAPIRRVGWQLALLGILLLAPIAISIRWLAGRLTEPLQDLTDTVGAMRSRQDLSLRADVTGEDEIGALARAFNDLADSLERASREREEALRRLAQLNVTLERRVRERTAELQKANAELKDAFEQLKAAQSQLVHSEKMASLGQLVAGVAHELNNPIGFIYANFQHLQEYTDELFAALDEIGQASMPKEALRHLEEILERHDIPFIREDLPKIIRSGRSGATRIKEIVSALRRFSRLEEAEVKPVLLEDGIDDTLAILHNQIKNRIEVVKNYRLRAPVECRSSQINQVFMNIIHNAIQAMGEKGRLEIVTEREDEMAVVRISDDGPGIPPEIRDRIFDPFFTTKKVGEGTGLGLSISYGIIQDHAGEILVESTPGRGATFIIRLPLRYRPSGKGEKQP
ncbi:MAG: HAMP domain-containing protein [Alphaproteobacteria bacterium]|nr:MAG: HAMP domain-containing protein [Alphaproteobacteria bacterium]